MAQPLPVPRLYTIAEYLALGEIEPGYAELAEGRLELNPSPAPRHNLAGSRLWQALTRQLPVDLVAVTDGMWTCSSRRPTTARSPA
jgi:hypothetical protein